MNLRESFSELKLYGMRESIDYRVMESAKAGLGYDEFLKLLIEDEQLPNFLKVYRPNFLESVPLVKLVAG
jgi:hypothetical protein